MTETTIQFEVMVRSEGTGRTATLDTLHRFRPPPDKIREVVAWLQHRGFVCHPSDYVIVCSGEPTLVNEVFQRTEDGALSIPDDLRHLVEQITLCAPPEYF